MRAKFLFLLLIPVCSHAAKVGRSLPRGEEIPKVIIASYAAPDGEVQFVKISEDGHSAFLRRPSGDLIGLQRVEGPKSCGEWLVSEKTQYPPDQCSFVFAEKQDSRDSFPVRASDLRENSIFDTVSSRVRGANVAL